MAEFQVATVDADAYRLPLPRVLSDATHGRMSDFELVTVRVRDTDGAEGVGYTYTIGHGGLAIHALLTADLAPLLVGSRWEIEAAWQSMWRRLHYVGRGGLASFAISAVDIALWDLAARRAELPLWQLLGGTQPQVPVYAGGIDLEFTIDELLQQVAESLERGFGAIKMKIGRAALSEDLQRVAAVRDQIGPTCPLMVDANMAWSVEQATTAARALREYDVFWLEEPIAPDDFAGHQSVAAATGIPIAAGENLHTEREFELLLESGGVAFPEPDVANVGGISAWLRVAAAADGHGLPVTSHGVHDLHVHLLSAVPNSSYLEYHGFGLNEFLADRLEIAAGMAVAPQRPGHGVQFLWDALRPYRENG